MTANNPVNVQMTLKEVMDLWGTLDRIIASDDAQRRLHVLSDELASLTWIRNRIGRRFMHEHHNLSGLDAHARRTLGL